MSKKSDLPPPLPSDFSGQQGDEAADIRRLIDHAAMLRDALRIETDQHAGAERDIAAWRMRCANLERDKERDAKASSLWPIGQRLFVIWREATGRTSRVKWSLDRFELVRPFLKDIGEDEIPEVSYDREAGPPQNPLEECMAAILGCAYDHFSDFAKNGKAIHYDDWEHVFGHKGRPSRKVFEQKMEKRPRDWRARLLVLDPEAPATTALPGLDSAAA